MNVSDKNSLEFEFKRSSFFRVQTNPYINKANLEIIERYSLNFNYINSVFIKVNCSATTSYIMTGVYLIAAMLIVNICCLISALFLRVGLLFNLYMCVGTLAATVLYFLFQFSRYYFYSVKTTRKLLQAISNATYSFKLSLFLNLNLEVIEAGEPGSRKYELEEPLNHENEFTLVNIYQPPITNLIFDKKNSEYSRDFIRFAQFNFPHTAYEIVQTYYNNRKQRKCSIYITYLILVVLIGAGFMLLWIQLDYDSVSNIGIVTFIEVVAVLSIYQINNYFYDICIHSSLSKVLPFKEKGFYILRAGVDTLTILEYNKDITNLEIDF